MAGSADARVYLRRTDQSGAVTETFSPPDKLIAAAPILVDGATAPVAQQIAGRQPKDATLTALAALATAADQLIYATGPDAFATTAITAFARSLLSGAAQSDVRSTLGLGSAASLTAAVAGGAATLDASTGRLLAAQIPDALLGSIRYQGGWNAATNSPALPAPATANKGWYYIVLTAGTTSLPGPSGAITDWQIGDWAVSDGTYWEKVDSSDQVISVAGLQGAITALALKAALVIGVADIVDASANGRSLISASNYAAMRALLGLVIGANVQAWDTDLDAIAALTTTSFGRSLLTFSDATATKSALGLPTGATTAYTPTITSTSGTITTLGTVVARYQMINAKLCYVILDISITTAGTANGTSALVSLPFTASTATYQGNGRELSVNGLALTGTVNPNQNTVAISKYDNTGPIANGVRLNLTLIYEIA